MSKDLWYWLDIVLYIFETLICLINDTGEPRRRAEQREIERRAFESKQRELNSIINSIIEHACPRSPAVWYITSSHSKFAALMDGWKNNMSIPGSKLIAGRIQWSEETGLLPLIVLGVKGERVRYAVYGGSEDIQYAELSMFTVSDEMFFLGNIDNNDDVQAWRDGIKKLV